MGQLPVFFVVAFGGFIVFQFGIDFSKAEVRGRQLRIEFDGLLVLGNSFLESGLLFKGIG